MLRNETPSMSLFRRNIDRDPPTLPLKNLMSKFVDEGDMILGRAFLSGYEREIYGQVRIQVYEALQYPRDLFTDLVHSSGRLADTDEDKILFFKMLEKAVDDWIKEQLS